MTVTVKENAPLVVPSAVRRQAGLKSGDEIEFKVSGDVITIFPKSKVAAEEYTPEERLEIDRGIARSEKQYAAGKSYGPFATPADAIESINTNLRRRASARRRKPPGR
jgi:AbrB family looped-hinge helix DNA binding protein